MLPTSNQPGQLYGTAIIHKLDNTADIAVDNLKFCPIIAQSRTYTYNAVQIIANYLKSLCSNNEVYHSKHPIIARIIREQSPLKSNEQCVSYNIEPLFTNIPVHKTIEYIINKIQEENKLPKLFSKLIFKSLLLKLTTEYFYAQFKIL